MLTSGWDTVLRPVVRQSLLSRVWVGTGELLGNPGSARARMMDQTSTRFMLQREGTGAELRACFSLKLFLFFPRMSELVQQRQTCPWLWSDAIYKWARSGREHAACLKILLEFTDKVNTQIHNQKHFYGAENVAKGPGVLGLLSFLLMELAVKETRVIEFKCVRQREMKSPGSLSLYQIPVFIATNVCGYWLRTFGVIRIRASDPRALASWGVKLTDESVHYGKGVIGPFESLILILTNTHKGKHSLLFSPNGTLVYGMLTPKLPISKDY